MSFRAKKWIVYGFLIAFTAWPLVHLELVRRFDLNPWKLAGWGMYSAPRPNYRGMEIYGQPQGSTDFVKLASPSSELAAEATSFLERYRWLRQLVSPDALEEAVRREHPDWSAIRIVVFRTHVEPDTGMVVMKEFAYDYPG